MTGNPRQLTRLDSWGIVLLALTVGWLGHRSTDKVDAHFGCGWDGLGYALRAQAVAQARPMPGLDGHTVQRIVPSWVVGKSIRWLHSDPTFPRIIARFGRFNILMLGLAAWGLCAAARTLNLSPRAAWLGAAGLVFSHCAAKWLSYYPVLTDGWAMAEGAWLLVFYLRRQIVCLAVLSVLGAYTWPTMLLLALPLLLFPRPRAGEQPAAETGPRLNPVAGVCGGLASLGLMTLFVFKGHTWFSASFLNRIARLGPLIADSPRQWASVLSLGIYGGFVTAGLLPRMRQLRDALRLGSLLPGIVAFAAVLAAVKAIHHAIPHQSGPFERLDGVWLVWYMGLSLPFQGVVAMIQFFGPPIALVVLAWPEVARIVRATGLGLTVSLAANLALAVDPETRHVAHLFPVLIVLGVAATDRLRWRTSAIVGYLGCALLLSRIWYHMGPMGPEGTLLPHGNLMFSMSLALVRLETYLIVLGPVLLTLGWLGVALYWPRKTAAAAPKQRQEFRLAA